MRSFVQILFLIAFSLLLVLQLLYRQWSFLLCLHFQKMAQCMGSRACRNKTLKVLRYPQILLFLTLTSSNLQSLTFSDHPNPQAQRKHSRESVFVALYPPVIAFLPYLLILALGLSC